MYLPLIQKPKPLEILGYKFRGQNKGTKASLIANILSASDQVISNPIFQVRQYFGANLVQTVSGTTFLSTTLPGQMNRIEITVRDVLSPNFDRVELDLISWDTISTTTIQVLQVSQTQQYRDPFGPLDILSQGLIINPNSSPISAGQVLLWCSDNGSSTVFTFTMPIPPGASIPYDNLACRLDDITQSPGIVVGVAQGFP